MSQDPRIFTSESVSEGHPDKVCDQISDGILDAILEQDRDARVACETLTSRGLVVITGEITTTARVDYAEIARTVIRDVGYQRPELGFDADSCGILTAIGQQSPDIALGVDSATSQSKEQGAGDQGMMFGFACRETDALMPFPIHYAHRILEALAAARKSGRFPFLRPDSKSQLSVRYDEQHNPVTIDNLVISHQHDPDVSDEELRSALKSVACEVLPEGMLSDDTRWYLNPTGRFVDGGPKADAGLTGRKIIVDTYGGAAPHGGGSFSGKDPSKVDRSASYAARYLAKNVVAAGLAERCTIQLAYAIGLPQPLAVYVETHGTGRVDEDRLSKKLHELVDLSPHGILRHLGLARPVYARTAAYGHFGRPPEADGGFSWERLDLVDELSSALA